MMFRTVIVLLVISVGHSLYAQQQVLNHISNEYILAANELKTVAAVNQLKNTIYKKQFGKDDPAQVEEVDERSAYFKVLYKKSAASIEEGLVSAWYMKNTGSTTPIEEIVNSYYKMLRIDNDPADYIIDYANDSTIDGGFFFNKKHNGIYIYTKSRLTKNFLYAYVEIHLTPEQKIAFAKDFILKTKFK